jgi:integrase
MPGIGEHEKPRADALAKTLAVRVLEGGFLPDEALETCGEYFERWTESRRRTGIRTTADERGRWRKWLAPHLAVKPMARVATRDLELVVSSLDQDVRAGKLAWKTAIHVWGLVTKMFDDAVRSKDQSLRARKDNPASAIRGPDRGHDKAAAFLFPSELVTLLSCQAVPLARRRLYALAVYLGARAGELYALEWTDIREAEGYVHVHRAQDRHTKKLKPTKTGITRRVPIEPTLRPLLEAMRDECDGLGRVVTAPLWNMADILRADLQKAGVARADLFADDETRRPLDFHDLRHTYGTWRAIRGDDVIKIRFAMGHTDLETTQRYINEAQVFDTDHFGVPFGPLRELISNNGKTVRKYAKSLWPLRDSNPRRKAA